MSHISISFIIGHHNRWLLSRFIHSLTFDVIDSKSFPNFWANACEPRRLFTIEQWDDWSWTMVWRRLNVVSANWFLTRFIWKRCQRCVFETFISTCAVPCINEIRTVSGWRRRFVAFATICDMCAIRNAFMYTLHAQFSIHQYFWHVSAYRKQTTPTEKK